MTDLDRRVVGTPTKLYNKHWDNFIGKHLLLGIKLVYFALKAVIFKVLKRVIKILN